MRFETGGVVLDAQRGPIVVTDFDPGERTLRTDDVEIRDRAGGIPRRDVEGISLWQFSILTEDDDAATALEHAARVMAAWRPPEALLPGVLVPMVYELAGRRRIVYGRPGAITPPDGRFVDQGEAELAATWRVLDPLAYSADDGEDGSGQVEIGIVPASSAGLVFPATPPFVWRSSGEPQSRWAEVGGEAATPLVVTIRGPVTRPWIRVGAVLIELQGSLAYDEQVTIDARRRLVSYADGRPAAGLLSPRSRLADLRLAPGRHEITFGGTDETGTATATIAWRAAWRSI